MQKWAKAYLKIISTQCVYKSYFNIYIYIYIYIYNDDLVSNNLQWLIYHKTKPICKLISFGAPAECRGPW